MKGKFETPGCRLGMVIFGCVIGIVLGIIGVSGARTFGTHYAHVTVSPAWYLLAIVPPTVVGIVAIVLRDMPARVATVLALVAAGFSLTEPFLYTVYDMDRRSQSQVMPAPER